MYKCSDCKGEFFNTPYYQTSKGKICENCHEKSEPITVEDVVKIFKELDLSKEKAKVESTPLMRELFTKFNADFDRGDLLVLGNSEPFEKLYNTVSWLFDDRVALDKNNYLPSKTTYLVLKGDQGVKPITFETTQNLTTLLRDPLTIVDVCS